MFGKVTQRTPARYVAMQRIRVGKTAQLDAYLIAERLSEADANQRRRHLKHRAKRKSEKPSQIRLRLAGWNLYITNIESSRLTPKQICVIAGIRWQVELMFKAFKSLGQLNVSRSRKPYRILCALYAKLIAALIRHSVFTISTFEKATDNENV